MCYFSCKVLEVLYQAIKAAMIATQDAMSVCHCFAVSSQSDGVGKYINGSATNSQTANKRRQTNTIQPCEFFGIA
jgi:hypothetical protein